jgi:hypothetical protein
MATTKLSPQQRAMLDVLRTGATIEEIPYHYRGPYSSGLYWQGIKLKRGRKWPRIRRNTLESLVDRGLVWRQGIYDEHATYRAVE